jgi:hypothetical protein
MGAADAAKMSPLRNSHKYDVVVSVGSGYFGAEASRFSLPQPHPTPSRFDG